MTKIMKLLRLGGPLPSTTATLGSNQAPDPECFDFTEYLGVRLGVNAEAAAEVLTHWLQTYEPLKRRQSRTPDDSGWSRLGLDRANSVTRYP